MQPTDFVRKLMSRYLWGNLIAMILVIVALMLGTKWGIDIYTHHGEEVAVPDLSHRSFEESRRLLENLGLNIEVVDTGYAKRLPPDCILSQIPEAGQRVKTGRTVFVTINAPSTPTLTLPDIIDNSSLREATARLRSLGFRVGQPTFIPGEKDWVYGVIVRGKHLRTGDRVPVDAIVTIEVGNGMRDEDDSLSIVEPMTEDGDDVDEFVEIPVEPQQEDHHTEPTQQP